MTSLTAPHCRKILEKLALSSIKLLLLKIVEDPTTSLCLQTDATLHINANDATDLPERNLDKPRTLNAAMVVFDSQKAFSQVSHGILLTKLSPRSMESRIPGDFVRRIASYFSGRTPKMRVVGCKSTETNIPTRINSWRTFIFCLFERSALLKLFD